MHKYIFRGLTLVIFVMLTACNTSNENVSNPKPEQINIENNEQPYVEEVKNQEDTKNLENNFDISGLPALPTNLQEAVDYPIVGQFAGEEVGSNLEENNEITNILNQIPPITIEDSEETIENVKRYIYSLFKENLSMPDVPLDQWNSMQINDPQLTSNEIKLKENYNVAILLDSSGSMGFMEGNQTRMELAKQSINEFVKELPEQANISLQVYGHVGSGSENDKAESCSHIEEVYSLGPYNESDFEKALNQFNPAGWTPMAKAIEQVEEDFKSFGGKENTNIFYIVSDGVETCEGDPIAAIQSLAQSDIAPVINIIGYQVDNEGLQQLKEMAKVSGARYINARNQQDLKNEFQQTVDMSQIWSEWHLESKDIIRELHNTMKHQLYNWNNDEKEKTYRENNNIKYALKYLYDKELLDVNVYLSLGDEYIEKYLELSDERGDIYSDLYEINYETYKDKFAEVEMKFKSSRE